MRRRLRLLAMLLPIVLLSATAEGQGGAAGRGRADRARSSGATPMRRQQLEQQLRRGLWRIAKQRVGLTDAQMSQLEQSSQRFDAQRRALAQDERAQRVTLRREMLADGNADQTRIATALDRIFQLQRERIDLQVAEQREFAVFMTPLQRAKYATLQEQVRRRVEALRRQRPDTAPRAELP